MYYISPLPDPVSLHTTFLQSSSQICCTVRNAQINFPCFDKLLYISEANIFSVSIGSVSTTAFHHTRDRLKM